MDIISIISTITAIVGNLFINLKKRIGFIIWIISNITWILYNFVVLSEPNWSMIIMYIVYLGLNIHGFIHWRDKNDSNLQSN